MTSQDCNRLIGVVKQYIEDNEHIFREIDGGEHIAAVKESLARFVRVERIIYDREQLRARIVETVDVRTEPVDKSCKAKVPVVTKTATAKAKSR